MAMVLHAITNLGMLMFNLGNPLQKYLMLAKTLALTGLPVAALLLLLSSPANADILYTFIKMTCDPDSQTATIKVFYDSGESGEARSKHPEDGTYYLDDIGSTIFPKLGKQVICDVAPQRQVSFSAYKGNVPKKDSLHLYLDGTDFGRGGFLLGDGGFELNVRMTGDDAYTLKFCPNDPVAFFAAPDVISENKHQCQISHVVGGKLKDYQIVEPQQ
jgi:hypothetical protein